MPAKDGTGPAGTGPIGGRRGRCNQAVRYSSVEGDSLQLSDMALNKTGNSMVTSDQGKTSIGYGRRVRGRIMRRRGNERDRL